MPGGIPARAAALASALALQLLAPLAPVAQAQATTSLPLEGVGPAAPEPVSSFLARLLSFLMFVAVTGGLLATAYGIFKFVTGGEDAGRWMLRGIAGVVLGLGFWAIVKFFLT